ncbi:hypothetical protein HII31_05643 [Pseudocercospora fuligena]|uniref:AB hydrolase-1 domain-containing protein n=1 Tax=Pseudocercospora fuligena TaxID=685502 RepID=A0A8H6RLE2_9PEZI|nr:hypothetical protein HII31_05643 [Pseudocercospora fuligena]
MSSSPTIIIVPGAWHRQFHIQPFLDEITRRGHRVQCVPLRNSYTDLPRPSWEDEVTHISRPIQHEINAGRDVCVLLHSYAGIPGSEALNRIVRAGGLEEQPGKGRLVRAIFFSAFTFPAGFVVDTKMFVGPDHPEFSIGDDGLAYHSKPYEAFFNDLSREDAQPYVDQIKPYYYILGGGQISSDDWKRIPRTIIGAKNDLSITKAALEQMWAEFRDEMQWIETGHTPFPAKPKYMADVILGHLV